MPQKYEKGTAMSFPKVVDRGEEEEANLHSAT